ncbi:MAG: helix-turn-helix domain-containing protein [Clostridia bacterium]|nr:helix-turn-helix domain-containing protein [Clostridia bacterium]
MAMHRVWDRGNQMPPGREFEAYHFVDTNAQPVYYHSHPHYEIYFFIQGHSRIIVEGLDIQPVKGDVLIYPPGIMHRNIHVDAEIPYERFYYFARREFLQSVSAADYDIPGTLEKMTQNDHYFYHVEENDLARLIALTDQVIEASERTHPADKLMNRNRFTILLLEALAMMSSREVAPQSNYSKGMSDLIRYINLHATEPLSLDDLAGAFYASKYEILREFKKYTGISIHQYLIMRRILIAQELIKQGIKPKDASIQCGFSDYSSFYRAFKMRVGASPEQYRSAQIK